MAEHNSTSNATKDKPIRVDAFFDVDVEIDDAPGLRMFLNAVPRDGSVFPFVHIRLGEHEASSFKPKCDVMVTAVADAGYTLANVTFYEGATSLYDYHPVGGVTVRADNGSRASVDLNDGRRNGPLKSSAAFFDALRDAGTAEKPVPYFALKAMREAGWVTRAEAGEFKHVNAYVGGSDNINRIRLKTKNAEGEPIENPAEADYSPRLCRSDLPLRVWSHFHKVYFAENFQTFGGPSRCAMHPASDNEGDVLFYKWLAGGSPAAVHLLGHMREAALQTEVGKELDDAAAAKALEDVKKKAAFPLPIFDPITVLFYLALETDWIRDELEATRVPSKAAGPGEEVRDRRTLFLLNTSIVNVDVSGTRVAYTDHPLITEEDKVMNADGSLQLNDPWGTLLRHTRAWKMFVDAGFKTTDKRDAEVAEYIAAMHKLFYLVYCERGPEGCMSTA